MEHLPEAFLQRLFSTFANGWPGAGILLLRLSTASALAYSTATHFRATPQAVLVLLQIIGTAAALFLLMGLWTPVAGVVCAAAELWIARTGASPAWISVLLANIGISLAMIGPGAWSVDARLFGRKHIEGSEK
jgi:putative oxidoreductase